MYLHLPHLSPLHSPSRKAPPPPDPGALFHSIECSLLRQLRSLLPVPPAPSGTGAGAQAVVSLSYLSRAAGVLSSVQAVAGALVSDPSLSGSDEVALSLYIGSSIKLLDVCNAVSAEVERLHLGRLLLVFVAHLLHAGGDPPPENIWKARESIREWEESSPRGRRIAAAAGLIRNLQPRVPRPSGKATALGRAIFAVEAVSALIAGALVAFLGGEVDLASGSKVPPAFAWAEAFNDLRTALSGDLGAPSPWEVRAVEASVRKLADILDEPPAEEDEEKTERLRSAVKELERATEELTDGLDRLRGAVNELFHAVLCTRNAALQRFRLGPNKCK